VQLRLRSLSLQSLVLLEVVLRLLPRANLVTTFSSNPPMRSCMTTALAFSRSTKCLVSSTARRRISDRPALDQLDVVDLLSVLGLRDLLVVLELALPRLHLVQSLAGPSL